MKAFFLEFLKRGLLAAAGGPVILAMIYGILGATGTVDSLAPGEVCMGILTITLLAFVAAGLTSLYQLEQLPLASAIMIHGGCLYLSYLAAYLLNSWIPRDLKAIGFFSAVFAAGYALVWLCIYLVIRANTKRLNEKLSTDA